MLDLPKMSTHPKFVFEILLESSRLIESVSSTYLLRYEKTPYSNLKFRCGSSCKRLFNVISTQRNILYILFSFCIPEKCWPPKLLSQIFVDGKLCTFKKCWTSQRCWPSKVCFWNSVGKFSHDRKCFINILAKIRK